MINPKTTFDNQDLSKYDKLATVTLLVGIILLIVIPFIFTREAIFKALDFSQTGQIGDTIGGLTAPFMSLIGSGLVYLSFRMQTKMNQIQFSAIQTQFLKSEEEDKERNFNKLLDLIMVLKENYNEEFNTLFSHRPNSTGIQSTLNSLVKFYKSENPTINYNPIFRQLENNIGLLSIIIDIKDRILKSNVNNESKDILKIQLYLFLSSFNAFSIFNKANLYFKQLTDDARAQEVMDNIKILAKQISELTEFNVNQINLNID